MGVTDDARIVFTLAILLSIVFPWYSRPLSDYIIPLLIASMSVSLRGLKLDLSMGRQAWVPVIRALSLHFIAQNAVILAASWYLIRDPDFLAGMIILASVPPAVSCVPFTFLLKGDAKTSTITEILSYVLSLIITPLMILWFIGGHMDVAYLVRLLLLLILLPLLASRILGRINTGLWVHSKSFVTLCFGLITYIIIGLNHQIIRSQATALLPILAVVIIKTFVLGSLVFFHYLGREGYGRAVSYTLFSSYKNNGAAAVIALSILPVKASLPFAFASFAEIAFFILLKQLSRNRFPGS
ncbi:hypothetical protein ACFLRF_03955 [Candidatus Altiarchaeota archaeon]